MSYNDEVKYDAIVRVEAGQTYDEVATALDVGKGTVIRWHKEYKTAKDQATLHELYDVERLILATAQLQERSPEGMVEVIQAASDKLGTGVKGLERLDNELQKTAMQANQRIQSLMLSVEHVSELEVLVECLCSLRKAFFDKGPQIAVQQNFGGSKYGNFLGDKPGA